MAQRFEDVLIRRVPARVGPALKQEILSMMTPEAMVALWALIVVWVGLHGAGGIPGLVADVLLIGAGTISLGFEIIRVLREFAGFTSALWGANNEQDLERAAGHLATVVTVVGFTGLLTLLMRFGRRGPMPSPEARRLADRLPGQRITFADGEVVASRANGRGTDSVHLFEGNTPGARAVQRYLQRLDDPDAYLDSKAWRAAEAKANRATRELRRCSQSELDRIYASVEDAARRWGVPVEEKLVTPDTVELGAWHPPGVTLTGPLASRQMPPGGRVAARAQYKAAVTSDRIEVARAGRITPDDINSLLHELYHSLQSRMYASKFPEMMATKREWLETTTQAWVAIQLRRLARGEPLEDPTRGFR